MPGSGKGNIEKAGGGSRGRKARVVKKILGAGQETQEMSFELPLCSKYLLLAAYIASRNAATLDASLFDTGAGACSGGRRKRK